MTKPVHHQAASMNILLDCFSPAQTPDEFLTLMEALETLIESLSRYRKSLKPATAKSENGGIHQTIRLIGWWNR